MTKEEQRENNVKRVLEEAIESFKEVGIEATTQTLLAEKTNLTTKTIGRYFSGKEVLANAAVELFLEQSMGEINKKIRELNGDKKNALELLELYLDLQFQKLYDDARSIILLKHYESYILGHGEIEKKGVGVTYFSELTSYCKALEEVLVKGKKEEAISSKIDVQAASFMIVQSFIGFIQKMAFYFLLEQMDKELMRKNFAEYKSMVIVYLQKGR